MTRTESPWAHRLMRTAVLLSALGLAIAQLTGCAAGPRSVATPHALLCDGDTQVVGVTLLKSHDADPGSLVAFIQANWFEIDRIAVEQGLLTSYDLLAKDGGDDAPWNVVVLVGYPTAGGYADITAAFEAIRSAHEVVPIDGLTQLSDLGRFVSGSELQVRCD
ncbi:MAG: hypothetical protein AAF772_07740 [Acidobacteriota bacterium]